MDRNFIKLHAFLIVAIITYIGPIHICHAFHSGSSGECKECHSGKDSTLIGSDAGSTCLRCHRAPTGARQPTGYYVATGDSDMYSGIPPVQLTPGGDFGWLKKSYSWKYSGVKNGISPGERHGHNIVAMDFGFEADKTHHTVPKGIYPSGTLSCISCHDPHGKINRGDGRSTAYRMLGGIGYQASSANGIVFTVNPPAAVAPRNYNRSEAITDTRIAYGRGMSEWCANCHTGGCSGVYGHPTCSGAKCNMETVSNYNAYIKSGDINGMKNTSYTSLVPFEEGTNDITILAQHAKNDGSYAEGPDFNSNIMCLTCHRAHASGWDHIARWNMKANFIVSRGAYPGTNNGAPSELAQGRSAAETQQAYYGRPSNRFAAFQKGLCNKCHIRD